MKNSSGKSMEFTLLVVPAAKKKDEDEDGKKEEDGKKKRKRKKDKNAEILDKYVVFATNLPLHSALHAIKTLPEDYRRRWGIETGYRQITMSSPKTTSRSGPYRWLLFFVSMFMHNMWAIERFMARTRFEMVTLKAVVCATAKAALVACNSCRPRGNFGGPG